MDVCVSSNTIQIHSNNIMKGWINKTISGTSKLTITRCKTQGEQDKRLFFNADFPLINISFANHLYELSYELVPYKRLLIFFVNGRLKATFRLSLKVYLRTEEQIGRFDIL